MKALNSDSESNLSTDSLEEPREQNKYYARQCEKESNRQSETIPFYQEKVPTQEITKNSNSDIVKVSKSHHSSTDFSSNSQNSFRGSYFTYIPRRTVSARIDPCRQRPSRRRSTSVVSNCDTLRTRHRSVSYLEQFRKKNYGTHKTDSTVYSTVGSKDSENSENLSFVSFAISDQGRMSISELDFYDDIIKNSLSSSTQIQKELDISRPTPKKSKNNTGTHKLKQKEDKLMVLPKVEKLNQQEKKEIDKRNALKKREAYAKKVKLKNQIEIKSQKEKERLSQFKNVHLSLQVNQNQNLNQTSSVMANFSDQSCKNMLSVPFTDVSEPPSRLKPKKKAKPKCLVKNEDVSKRRNQIKKPEVPHLIILQQRHEREKCLVDSIKNLILKNS